MRELSRAPGRSSSTSTSRGAEFAADSRSVGARRTPPVSSSVDCPPTARSPAGVDADALAKDVVAETLGTGPLEELIADEGVREIAVPRHDRIFVDRGGTHGARCRKWFSSPDAVARAVERLLARAGRPAISTRARSNGALVEARLENGLLLTAALPPLAARRSGGHAAPAATRSGHARRPRRAGAAVAGHGRLPRAGGQGAAQHRGLGAGRQRALDAARGAGARGDDGERRGHRRGSGGAGSRRWAVDAARRRRGAGAREAIDWRCACEPERLVVGDVRGAEALDLRRRARRRHRRLRVRGAGGLGARRGGALGVDGAAGAGSAGGRGARRARSRAACT